MKTKLLTILFLLIAGCSPTEEQKADVQTRTDEPQGEAVDEEPAGDDEDDGASTQGSLIFSFLLAVVVFLLRNT